MSGYCGSIVADTELLWQVRFRLTQTVTQTGFGRCGNNGANAVKPHGCPQRKGAKRSFRRKKHNGAAAHNPEVVGSNPAPATRKPLESQDSGGFILFLYFFGCWIFTVSLWPRFRPIREFGAVRAGKCRKGRCSVISQKNRWFTDLSPKTCQEVDPMALLCYNTENQAKEVDKMTFRILIKSSAILSAD